MIGFTHYEMDNRVRRYAEALAEKGDTVDVVSLKKRGQNISNELNGVKIYRIQNRDAPEKGKFSYLYYLLLFFIRSFVFVTVMHLRKSYDIVHVHSLPDFEVFSAIIPKIFGAKIILDIHDPVPDFFSAKFNVDKSNNYYRILSFIERISTKFADHVITVTDYWRETILIRSKIPPQKISVILNLPDIGLFDFNKYNFKEKYSDDFVILYPGTLNKHCGIDIMIEAMALVKNEIPNLKFTIYGNGTEIENIQRLIVDLRLEQNVSLNGLIPLEAVPELMFRADIGLALLAGQNEYSQQALNVKLFEFLAMGLPSVATKTKSTEYYLNEEIVMFSEQNNPRDVARCIKELYTNPEKREMLSINGRRFIEKHNWNSLKKQYFNTINELSNKSMMD